ncbi:MAG: copper homeostasis protein CutC [Luteolibacter sp.]
MLEICIDCVASARAAAEGGADRVELCANLPEGGTTPSAGMIRAVRDVFAGGLMVIIRPRGYDFLYSADEMQVMLHEIEIARELGADGVVIGCLQADGTVDHEANSRLIDAAGPLDITFHRAFDMTRDLNEALNALIGLGIGRVLTSGGKPDVPSGIETISKLVGQADDRISIMPGGGLTEDNIGEMVRQCGVHEAHLSARHAVASRMKFINHECFMGTYSRTNEYEWRESSAEKIRLAKQRMIAARA